MYMIACLFWTLQISVHIFHMYLYMQDARGCQLHARVKLAWNDFKQNKAKIVGDSKI